MEHVLTIDTGTAKASRRFESAAELAAFRKGYSQVNSHATFTEHTAPATWHKDKRPNWRSRKEEV